MKTSKSINRRGMLPLQTQAMGALLQAGLSDQPPEGMYYSTHQGIQGMLQEVRQLAVQYSNGSQTTQDQTAIQDSVNQLTQEIDRERTASSFNGMNLLDGTAGNAANGVVMPANLAKRISVSTNATL